MSEFDIIEILKQRIAVERQDVVLGISDDGACVDVPEGQSLVVSTDTLIEGVHFPTNTSAHAIGYKSLAVNLSDLAAMGAEPAWVTLALSLPKEDHQWLLQFADGFLSLAKQHNVALIGGDTTRGALSITVQVMGLAPKDKLLMRSGAQQGDYICVTGYLGVAGFELMQLNNNKLDPSSANKLNYPIPRVSAGIALREMATSAIDISDGLIADLGHILSASDVGARINLEELPISENMREDQDVASMQQLALTSGDDYELCFTIPESQIDNINMLQYQINLPIKHIGNIEKQHGLRLHRLNGEPLQIAEGGFDHFSKKPESF